MHHVHYDYKLDARSKRQNKWQTSNLKLNDKMNIGTVNHSKLSPPKELQDGKAYEIRNQMNSRKATQNDAPKNHRR